MPIAEGRFPAGCEGIMLAVMSREQSITDRSDCAAVSVAIGLVEVLEPSVVSWHCRGRRPRNPQAVRSAGTADIC
ncbi:hypothetical protein BI330_19500 [Mycobacterium sp. CBMA 623]|nr:hypothetical protein [Mycobacteroides sp. CBMA 326]